MQNAQRGRHNYISSCRPRRQSQRTAVPVHRALHSSLYLRFSIAGFSFTSFPLLLFYSFTRFVCCLFYYIQCTSCPKQSRQHLSSTLECYPTLAQSFNAHLLKYTSAARLTAFPLVNSSPHCCNKVASPEFVAFSWLHTNHSISFRLSFTSPPFLVNIRTFWNVFATFRSTQRPAVLCT